MDQGLGIAIMNLTEKILRILQPKERILKTIWRAEKDGKVNYLIGTAHFFPYHFRISLKKLFRKTKRALFEGPLDSSSLEQVVVQGAGGKGSLEIYEALDPETIQEIKRKTGDRFAESNPFPPFLPPRANKSDPLRDHFSELSPWLAFFNIWTSYLKAKGWEGSVDLEAFETAKRMGREIHFLETIEEQVRVLEQIPLERMIRFLEKVRHWDEYSDAYVQVYLRGALANWMAGTSDFPSRCSPVIDDRDRIFFKRMQPFLQKGETAVFLGAPHLWGVNRMLENDGHLVKQLREDDE
jgi:uncharacterized protein YbaP (TraB family)